MMLNTNSMHLHYLYTFMEIVAVCLKQSLRSNSDYLLTLSNLLIAHKRERETIVWCTRVHDCVYSLIINDNPTTHIKVSLDTNTNMEECIIKFNWLKSKRINKPNRPPVVLCKHWSFRKKGNRQVRI